MALHDYSDQELYDIIWTVNNEFYDLVYQDEWFKHIFVVIDQKIITQQQTDFMVQSMGGPKRYGGRSPEDAHPHIYIDEEIWEHREALLKKAFIKRNAPEDIISRWLKIDEAFKKSMIKSSVHQCKKRYQTDEIIYVPKRDKF